MEISPVYIHTSTKKPCISLDEVLRYMGSPSTRETQVISLALSAMDTALKVARCKAAYILCKPRFEKNAVVDLGAFKVQSKAFSLYLQECDFVFMLAATVGIDLDREIARASKIAPSKALALQAAGAAMIEAYCDLLCLEVFEKHAQTQGLFLKPRFSAGYEDLSLEYQKQILQTLDSQRKIGLTLTDAHMMLPSKSVTAFVGVCRQELCLPNKCTECKNSNCTFRKDDKR